MIHSRVRRGWVMGVIVGMLSWPGLMAWGETLAHYRFEDADASAGNNMDRRLYVDSSSQGNPMIVSDAEHAPKPVTEVPFSKLPQTGQANRHAIRCDGNHAMATMPDSPLAKADLGPGGSNAWTLEASFKLEKKTSQNQAIVGRDGNPAPNRGDNEQMKPILSLKFRPDSWDGNNANRISMEILDNAGRRRMVRSKQPVELNKWYAIAATASGTEMALWLKTEKDADYQLQGTISLDGALYSQNFKPGAWSIGRGYWDGKLADWCCGLIDEVRISNQVLDKSQFLASPRKNNPAAMERLVRDETFENELTHWAVTEAEGSSISWSRTGASPVVRAEVRRIPGIAPWQVSLKQWLHQELAPGQSLILIVKMRSPTQSRVHVHLEKAQHSTEKIIAGKDVKLEAEFKDYTFTGVVKDKLESSQALINLQMGIDDGVIEVASIRLIAVDF